MKLAECGKHGLTIVARPTAPLPLKTMMDDDVNRAFHRPTANRIASDTILMIAHARLVVAKVSGHLAQLIVV